MYPITSILLLLRDEHCQSKTEQSENRSQDGGQPTDRPLRHKVSDDQATGCELSSLYQNSHQGFPPLFVHLTVVQIIKLCYLPTSGYSIGFVEQRAEHGPKR